NQKRSLMDYNDLDLMTTYLDESEQQVVKEDGSLSDILKQTQFRSNMAYNQLQQLVSYKEHRTRSNSDLVEEILFHKGRYDTQGRLMRFRETTTTKNMYPSQPDFEVTNTKERFSSTYNGAGLLESSTQILSSSSSPDLLIIEDTTDIKYDHQGREQSFVRNEHHTNKPGSTSSIDMYKRTTRQNASYDERGRLRSHTDQIRHHNKLVAWTETLRTSDINYNEWGERSAYERHEESSQAPYGPASISFQVTDTDEWGQALATTERREKGTLIEIRKRSDMKRNAAGILNSYIETLNQPPSNLETKTTWKGNHDSLGRLIAFWETEKKEGTPLSTSRHQTNIRHNGLGQQLSYQETQKSSATPDLISTINWKSIGYNTAGYLDGFKQEKDTTGPETHIQDRWIRTNMGYRKNGLLMSYEDESWSSQAPDLIIRRQRKQTQYDGWGREFGFVEEERRQSEDLSMNIKLDRTRTATSYNDKGQMTAKKDRERSSLDPQVVDHIRWEGT
ncbi:hypothetical protein BVX98_01980, partial [bacterium F11]